MGVVKGFGESGVMISWGGAEPRELAIADVTRAPKKVKVADSVNHAKLQMPGLKWSQCSSWDNHAASRGIASFMVYSLYLKQSERDLHILEKPKAPGQGKTTAELEIYVKKDYDPYTFALVPYNSVLHDDGAEPSAIAEAAPLELVVTPEKEESTVLPFWIKKKETPRRCVLGAEKAPVLVPFWVLANEAREGAEPRDAKPLAYKTASVSVPPVAAMAKGLRQGSRENVKVRILYATNEVKLTKGDRVYLREGPPKVLPAV